MKTPNYVFDDELYHHGILGQRWGHRRFQYEDGSWTPEGRERYGEGEGPRQAAKLKVDARAKARASFENKKYKMYMKSKEQRLKDKIAAKEERNRVREAAKTERLARKEQAKIDKKMAVLKGTKLGKTKNMSDDDLQTAINRLKLEVEYNKNYAIASKPNSALARADRFFEGPTGQVVKAVAVATIPNVAQTIVSETLKSNLKYANKLDRDKAIEEINKKKADVEKVNAEAEAKRQEARNSKLQTQNDIRIANEQEARAKERFNRVQDRADNESNADIKINQQKQNLEAATAYNKATLDKNRQDREQARLDRKEDRADSKQEAEQTRLNNKQKHDLEMDTKSKMGFRDVNNNLVEGEYALRYNDAVSRHQNETTERNIKEQNAASERNIKEQNAASERNIKEAETLARINTSNRIQQNIQYMAEHNIPGSAEYAANASGALRATINIMSNPEIHSKPVSSLASLSSISNGTESRIRSLRSSGKSLREIGKILNMPTSTVASIFYDIKI